MNGANERLRDELNINENGKLRAELNINANGGLYQFWMHKSHKNTGKLQFIYSKTSSTGKLNTYT